jgi:hypothetical protein
METAPLTAVGSQWVKGTTGSGYSGWVYFLNWHTGELRYEYEERQPPSGYPTTAPGCDSRPALH